MLVFEGEGTKRETGKRQPGKSGDRAKSNEGMGEKGLSLSKAIGINGSEQRQTCIFSLF